MSISGAEEQKLCLLLAALREGHISESDQDTLNGWIVDNPDVRKAYIRYMKMCGHLYAFQLAAGFDRQDVQLLDTYQEAVLWQALAEDERNAPMLSISEEVEPAQVIQNVRDRKLGLKTGNRRIPVSLWISLISMAAMVLVIAFIYMNPPLGYEVATVTDSINLKWSSPLSLQKGTRLLVSSERVELQRGIIKLQTDKGVDVVIEAPARFRFSNPDEIEMNRGRLVAVVPESGSGFAVRTNNSKIIDLGTEFGIYADFQGQTELHMFKGKTVVIAGQDRQPKQIIEVSGGRAVRLDLTGQGVQDIPLQPDTFARDIDSQAKLVWRHDRYIDLADIVGGGNGTGNGSRDKALGWDGEKLVSASEAQPPVRVLQAFVPVRCSPFIDGIFIPSGRSEAVKLSSNAAELNLDEFLKQDTNGLITLMVLKKDSDISSFYWFYSKEGAAGDRTGMPSLYFPRGANGQPAVITTADGRGADTYITNDVLNRYNRFGEAYHLACRYIKDERLRIVYLRFDTSKLNGDLSGAVLNLCQETGNRKRTLEVYGLNDGPADFWDEAAIDYKTSPGLKAMPLGNYHFDAGLCTRLGTFGVTDNLNAARPIAISADRLFTWTAPPMADQMAYAITNADSYRDSELGRAIPLRLGNALCGTRDNPSILMHASAGMTFDLDALRRECGPLKSFTALCGLSPSGQADGRGSSASFYVLLDGQEVFSAVDMTPQDDPQTIDLELAAQKRYLTLITTQGGDDSSENDLCVFVKPQINFE